MYALLLDQKRNGREPSRHLPFLSSLQFRIVNTPKQYILEWHFLIPFTSYHFLLIHSLSLKSIFQRMILGSLVSKLLRILYTEPTPPPQSDEVEHLGWYQSSQVSQASKQFSDFWFPLHRAPFKHSEKCLQLCGRFLSMGCECQSSWQSSLTPFTHSCVPEWRM